MNILADIINDIDFQIRKHGQYAGYTNAEDYINSLSNYELLELISRKIEENDK